MAYTFVLSDGTLNCYGFRILTEGIDLEQFKKNPLMLWMHQRSDKWNSTDRLPIGNWTNIRVEGDKLLADAVFDEKDEFAKKIKDKVDAGIIKMASIGIDEITTTMDVNYLLPGQTKETISKCKAIEGSIVDIGGNDNALKLFDKDGRVINLAAESSNSIIPLLNTNQSIQTNKLSMKNIAIALNMPENSTEADLVTAINKLLSDKQKADNKVTELAKKISDADEAKAVKLVDDAIKSKKLSADKKDSFINLAKADFNATESILNGMSPIVKPGDIIKTTDLSKIGGTEKKLNQYSIDELETLKKDDINEYKRLYKECYGIEFKQQL